MSRRDTTSGPLNGVTVLELAGIGPGPYAAMLLADYGADVIRIDRPADRRNGLDPSIDLFNRGKRSIVLDMASTRDVEIFMKMVEKADVVIEGNRPGIVERLGIGPEECHAVNPRLVYGRMTGWGQTGPYAQMAGHDLTYIAITGVLHGIGAADGPPQIPLNLIGDFGGGGAFMALGIVAALHEASRSGQGQVIDASITDGTVHLATGVHAMINGGSWVDDRGVNLLDGGAPFYAIYETADSRHLAVAPIEPKFFAEFVRVSGIEFDSRNQYDKAVWEDLREKIAARLRERTLEEWTETFEGTDACVAPILTFQEAPEHPQMKARGSMFVSNGMLQPAIAPRFSRHGGQAPSTNLPAPGQHTNEILDEFGLKLMS